MSAARINPLRGITTVYISFSCDSFKVVRIDAAAHTTKVVKF